MAKEKFYSTLDFLTVASILKNVILNFLKAFFSGGKFQLFYFLNITFFFSLIPTLLFFSHLIHSNFIWIFLHFNFSTVPLLYFFTLLAKCEQCHGHLIYCYSVKIVRTRNLLFVLVANDFLFLIPLLFFFFFFIFIYFFIKVIWFTESLFLYYLSLFLALSLSLELLVLVSSILFMKSVWDRISCSAKK